jgi:hypothetical protein
VEVESSIFLDGYFLELQSPKELGPLSDLTLIGDRPLNKV